MLKNKFKQFFRKRNKYNKSYQTAQEVSFTDVSGKEITLEIRVNGNDTLLVMIDKKTETEFSFDKDLISLFSVLLQSYVLHEIFLDLN